MEGGCAPLHPTLWDPMDCSPPGSSVCGIFQARRWESGSISFFRWSSWPGDRTHVSYLQHRQVGSLPPGPLGSSDTLDLNLCIPLLVQKSHFLTQKGFVLQSAHLGLISKPRDCGERSITRSVPPTLSYWHYLLGTGKVTAPLKGLGRWSGRVRTLSSMHARSHRAQWASGRKRPCDGGGEAAGLASGAQHSQESRGSGNCGT